MKASPLEFRQTFSDHYDDSAFSSYYSTRLLEGNKKVFVYKAEIVARPFSSNRGSSISFWIELTFDVCNTHERRTVKLHTTHKDFYGDQLSIEHQNALAAILDYQLSGKYAENFIYSIFHAHYKHSDFVKAYLPEYYQEVLWLDSCQKRDREKLLCKASKKKPPLTAQVLKKPGRTMLVP